MADKQASKSDEVGGCLFLVAVAAGILWMLWTSAFGCFLADQWGYVTKPCALQHLQKAACNTERDVLAVDEITDSSYADSNGKRMEMRTVIYEFRKRPTEGPVSADVLRDTEYMFKNPKGEWQATCELPASK